MIFQRLIIKVELRLISYSFKNNLLLVNKKKSAGFLFIIFFTFHQIIIFSNDGGLQQPGLVDESVKSSCTLKYGFG